MMQYAILTAIGPDRPGLVDEVSQFIFQRGGNIEDSRMVNLRGQFAIMMLIGGNGQALAKIKAEVNDLSQATQLRAEVHPAQPLRSPAAASAISYRLTATAIDQAGIVHRISHLLREQNANIESLETHLVAAPITGSPMFEMEMIFSIPPAAPISLLRQYLNQLCDELNIDWQLAAM